MKTKNEVYVRIKSEKKKEKVFKLLKMFGEKTGSTTVDIFPSDNYVLKFYDGNVWYGISECDDRVSQSEKVTVSELKQILFREQAKKGDVVVFEGRAGKSIAEISHIEGDKVYVKNELFIETGNRYSDGYECVSNFIRYATEEEKALLNPDKELEVGKWYKSYVSTYNDYILAFYSGNNEFSYGFHPSNDNEWFGNHFWFSDFNRSLEWKEATPEEIKQALTKEAEKRYGKNWETVKIKEHADGGRWIGLGLNKFLFTPGYYQLSNNLYSSNGVIFHNGKWAEKLEELPKINALDVAVVDRLADIVEKHYSTMSNKPPVVNDARQPAEKLRKLL